MRIPHLWKAFSYFLLRIATFPLAFLPLSFLHALGNALGLIAYFTLSKFRKRSLSNLSLAPVLKLSNAEVKKIAKASFQNLMITCLEYPKLQRVKNIQSIVTCENPTIAEMLLKKGEGLIFFCGHQSNWELLFLEGTSRMKGVAIGRPIKNHFLYAWILKIRERFGGKIITPQNAFKEGLRALKKGLFLGIVGDQGMPESSYSKKFLGREALTSPLPALLSYKTKAPLIVATTRREKGKYHIHYSEPLFPNEKAPLEEEVKRLMDAALTLFEESVVKTPEEWLWQHNRWKQQPRSALKKAFRHDSLAIVLSEDVQVLKKISFFREIYPKEFIALFVPEGLKHLVKMEAEVISYRSILEILREDFRFKLLFNFTGDKTIDRHYKKFSLLHSVHLSKVDESLFTLLKK